MAPWYLPNRAVGQLYFLAFVAALLTTAGVASATVRNVPGDFPTIQQAIDASTFGDVVLVAPGDYSEDLSLVGPRANGVRLASTSGPGFTTLRPGPVSVAPLSDHRVLSISSVGNSTIVEGFTITGGHGFGFASAGGGILMVGSDVIVRNNVITGNSAGSGGGIWVDGGAPTISGNTISHNSAFSAGGGLAWISGGSGGQVIDNLFIGNSVFGVPEVIPGGGRGGGLFLGASPHVSRCTIVGNTATRGGGIFVAQFASPALDRTIVALNGSGLEVDAGAGISISCSDVFGNSGGNYIGISDPAGLAGNQSVDPLFCDPPGLDFAISSLSPCAPLHSPSGCGLVGALPPTCAVTPAKRASWGQVKAHYR